MRHYDDGSEKGVSIVKNPLALFILPCFYVEDPHKFWFTPRDQRELTHTFYPSSDLLYNTQVSSSSSSSTSTSPSTSFSISLLQTRLYIHPFNLEVVSPSIHLSICVLFRFSISYSTLATFKSEALLCSTQSPLFLAPKSTLITLRSIYHLDSNIKSAIMPMTWNDRADVRVGDPQRLLPVQSPLHLVFENTC